MSIFWLVFHVIDMCLKCFATSDNLSGANFKVPLFFYLYTTCAMLLRCTYPMNQLLDTVVFEVRMINFNYGFLVTILIIDFTVECRSR